MTDEQIARAEELLGSSHHYSHEARDLTRALLAEVRASRAAAPLPSESARPRPADLVGALHDRVHAEAGGSRPAVVAPRPAPAEEPRCETCGGKGLVARLVPFEGFDGWDPCPTCRAPGPAGDATGGEETKP